MHGDAMPNQTIEFVDMDLGEEFAVMITTDEEGNFSYGPVAPVTTITEAMLTAMVGTITTKRPLSTTTSPTSRWLSMSQTPLT